jgi:AbrB family looped-hinge helix DNA binding protein
MAMDWAEPMIKATIRSKGQLTLPKLVRDRLGLREGDRVEVTVVKEEIRLRPLRRYRASELPGLLRGTTVSFPGIAAEEQVLARALAERHGGRTDV